MAFVIVLAAIALLSKSASETYRIVRPLLVHLTQLLVAIGLLWIVLVLLVQHELGTAPAQQGGLGAVRVVALIS